MRLVDFNRDGFLDLVVVPYVDFDLAHTPRPGDKAQCQWKGLPVLCGPRGPPPETVSLYENDGQGHFSDVSDRVHITGPKDYYGFTALTGDFDNDGGRTFTGPAIPPPICTTTTWAAKPLKRSAFVPVAIVNMG